ncbi:MAG: ATP-grasp domain-containing protein [Actinomycetota bacterium]
MTETEGVPVGGELTALVLGVGGNVSQGILKALELCEPRPRVVAACVTPESAGLYTADRSHVSPYASDPGFAGWLTEVCRSEGVDVVMSGAEPVLDALSGLAAELRKQAGATAIVSSPETLRVGRDKLRTTEWLDANGFNAPATVDAEDADAVERLASELGMPLIAKPRFGKGAQGVVEVSSQRDLDWVAGRDDYVVQQLLGDEGSEYTVGCFGDSTGQVRGSMAMRRVLQQGTTVFAEAGDFPEVRAEAERIAGSLRPLGPCNVQLRLDGGRPVCFEINVRFSGTTPIRARLGFNEVSETIRHYVLGEPAREMPRVTSGIAVRYWNELYLDGDAFRSLAAAGRLDEPAAHSMLVEDYGVRS